MIIGILYEGIFDEEPIKQLVIRMLQESIPSLLPEKVICRPIRAGGQILTKIHGATKIFFEVDPVADLAVFISDIDKFPERKKNILAFIKDYNQSHPDRVIISAFPTLEFEDWFISEENALKHTFNLDMIAPLPYSDLKSKKRVEKIIEMSVNEDVFASQKDWYIKITRSLDLNVLARNDKEFYFFRESLRSKIEMINRN